MKSIVCLAAAVLATAGQWNGVSAAGIQRHAALLVFPSMVHPGDPVYISGGGYATSGHVPIALACPSARAALNGNFGYIGPRPGSEGTFTAYRITAPTPLGGKTIHCQVVARHMGRGAHIWGTTAGVTIAPRNRALSRCAIRICLRAAAFLVRLKGGAQGDVELSGWPGAVATIRIDRRWATTISRTVRLSWQGTRAVRMMIAPGLKRGMLARVHVSVRLGRASGQVAVKFHVLPTGR